jgi:hypothetical protein
MDIGVALPKILDISYIYTNYKLLAQQNSPISILCVCLQYIINIE